ncbi:MAG: alpha/beta hydrolase family protein [Gammaproteobacteria bacterium]
MSALAACAPATRDPVSEDPPAQEPPATMGGVQFRSAGANLNGVLYEAAGPGPHPTLLMLHGFPGNELNADIAQAVRRAGWNALIFHYRGSWGSEGEFGFVHVIEDSQTVFDALREERFAQEHRIDPAHVSVFGHSMGGFAALHTVARKTEARCVLSIAGANMASIGGSLAEPAVAAAVAARFRDWGEGYIRGISGEALVAELRANADGFDTLALAPRLAARPALLVTGLADDVTPTATSHDPLVAALRAAGAKDLQEVRLEADHAFNGARVRLAREVVGFLNGMCR